MYIYNIIYNLFNPYLIHIYDPFLRWQVLEVLYVNRRLLDPTEYRPNVPQPGETMGRSWENRGGQTHEMGTYPLVMSK